MAKIKNINGTASHATTCSCGSWLEHWETFSGMPRPHECIVSDPDCLEKEVMGTHVQKANDDFTWYIAPLCKAHSSAKNKELNISDAWPLVEANPTTTCD
jgi:hypothetical protein